MVTIAGGATTPPAQELEIYFGTELPTSAGTSAILDDGSGFTYRDMPGGGLSYGWDCQGDAAVDYSGGRRGLDRDNGLGINHFDRDGTCPGKVNWQIAVPNGAYTVTVDFGEDAWTHGCEVEGNIGDACPRPTAPCYHRQ
jgi:hypothetical protein